MIESNSVEPIPSLDPNKVVTGKTENKKTNIL